MDGRSIRWMFQSVFLHGDLSEQIYMEQPPDFGTSSTLFYQLQKSLYGLKQAPRAWYAKIDSLFIYVGFKHCEYHHTVYALTIHDDTWIVVIYAMIQP